MAIRSEPLLLLTLWLFALPAAAFDHHYRDYAALLAESVRMQGHQSRVDYRRLVAEPGPLDRVTARMEQVPEEEFEGWDRDRQIAFLINAYNAFTLRLVRDHYPVDSIKAIGGLFRSPWKLEFFTLFGRPANLDHIEHGLLRPRYHEPRIHFALVCAARGCPPLSDRPWLPERLDAQLEEAARRFLTDPQRNRYLPEENRLELSPLFRWYREDFEAAAGSVAAFVAPYLAEAEAERRRIETATVRYLDYDWSLNELPR
ncbi:MAG: DUF547 domain-containing protein [Gammaproteobacteria bacterium]|nr:MAG: DUF547 domain-containing protein [Gammaproteobacteria bacterium]